MELALGYPVLFLAGCVAGALNVVAGGGSFLTLPILMFLGLPAGVANGTNRIGILFQNIAAVWSFDRLGVLERGAWKWAALPAALGGALGAWLALQVGDEAFKMVGALHPLAVVSMVAGSRSTPSGARPLGSRRPSRVRAVAV